MANLYDTQIPAMYSKGLFEEKTMDLAPEHTDKITDVLFTGTAKALKSLESKDRPAVVTFNRLDGTTVAAAIVRFYPNEEDSTKPGNFNLTWTFNSDDIPSDALVIDISNPNVHPFYVAVAGEKYGIKFGEGSYIVVMLTYVLEQIKKWLDENAKDGSVVSVECDGQFQARVAVEGGEKVFALEADGEIKNLIKNDDIDQK